MTRLLGALVVATLLLAITFTLWLATWEIQKAKKHASVETPTFFFRNYLPDAIGIEYFKRVVKEDEVVTCYWITGTKDELLFHTCKQRSLYD